MGVVSIIVGGFSFSALFTIRTSRMGSMAEPCSTTFWNHAINFNSMQTTRFFAILTLLSVLSLIALCLAATAVPGRRTAVACHHPRRSRGVRRLWRLGPRSAVYGPDGLALSPGPRSRDTGQRCDDESPRAPNGYVPRVRADPRLGRHVERQGLARPLSTLSQRQAAFHDLWDRGAAVALAARRND